MLPPKISVIIPTFRRPQLLRQSIDSALKSGTGVEVIVVPNGPDKSWEAVATEYRDDPRVVFSAIEKPHANSARNHGMRQANGIFLRFLDDDDVLSPGASDLQCALLVDADAEICSGSVNLVDGGGALFRAWVQPETSDFANSILLPGRVTATVSHIFRREAIQGHEWDETVDLGQDTHWMNLLCRAKEWRWVRTTEVVGEWRHHPGPRTSSSAGIARHLRIASQFLLDTTSHLERHDRLSPARRRAAAAGLWSVAHAGFFLEPGYWWQVIRAARKLEPGSHPDISFYRWPLGRMIHPLLLEVCMVPKRWANHLVRRWRFRRGRLAQVLPP